MNRTIPAILLFVIFVFVLARPGTPVTGEDIIVLKRAGVSDTTLELIVKEKVIETAAFSVEDIVSLKKAGVADKTLRLLIQEGSFQGRPESIVYGRETQTIRHVSVQDVIDLKNNGVSDPIIQSVIESTKSCDEKDRDRAWRMLENLKLRIRAPVGR